MWFLTKFSRNLLKKLFLLQAQKRKQTLRFDIELEIGLFKEVININPYVMEGQDLTEAWHKVGENTTLACGVEMEMSARTAHQKIEQQIKYFKENNRRLLQK